MHLFQSLSVEYIPIGKGVCNMPAVAEESRKSNIFTVGKIEEGLVILVSDDLQLVEFPFDCLPGSSHEAIGVGSIISLQIEHDGKLESDRQDEFTRLQDQIRASFGKKVDETVFEQILNPAICTHSMVSAKWTSWKALLESQGWRYKLHSLDCYLDGTILQSNIDEAEDTMRVNNLEAGKSFEIQLVFRTSNGNFKSNVVKIGTKQEDDFSGLHLFLVDAENETNYLCFRLGALVIDDFNVDGEARPTHLIAKSLSEVPADILLGARNADIPILTPDWLKACDTLKKLCPPAEFNTK